MSLAQKSSPPDHKIEAITPENAASRQRLAGSDQRAIIYDQPWLNSFMRPLLIVVLVSCAVIVLVTLVQRIIPTLPAVAANILLGVAVFGATVSTLSSTLLAQPNQRLQRTVGYRIAELGILLAIARLLLWLFYTGFPTFNELITMPLSVIFDGIFWAALIIITIAWSVASEITSDLQRLALQADELYVAQHHYDRLGDVARTSSVDRTAVLNGFVVRWVSLGMFMLFLSALVRSELPQQVSMQGLFGVLRQQIETNVAIAVVIYFLCGLLLIGLSQLALLRSRWILDKMPMRSSILNNWPTYVTLLVGAVALIAALMPLGDTFLLGKILNFIISSLLMVAWGVMQFVMGLLMLLFSLFQSESPPVADTPQAVPTFAPPTPPPQAEAILPEWTGGVLFWVLMAVLLGNAALIYFGGKRLRLNWLRWLWDLIRLRWSKFSEDLQRWQRERLPNLRSKDPAKSEEDNFWERPIDPDKLSPLEQVRYYYLAVLRAAEKAGIPRASSETPVRYAPRLRASIAIEQSLSESQAAVEHQKVANTHLAVESKAVESKVAESKVLETESAGADEVELLTKNFVKVRYAGIGTDAQTLTQLRRAWKSLQDRLQQI